MHRWDRNDTIWGEKPVPPQNRKIGSEWPRDKSHAFFLGLLCGIFILALGFLAVLDVLHKKLALVPR